MRVAILVKQVPRFEEMELGPDGRLRRDGVELELNPYCRRAVSKGAELAREAGGTSTVFTLGPPSAEDCLREAIAWGVTSGVLVTDPAFAGSDTLATARALAAALRRRGPFDLVLCGRNSVDADTGQVGPAVAELLGLPFAGPARELDLHDGRLRLRCELDDGHQDTELSLPAVVSCAERLCAPAKIDPEERVRVHPERIHTLDAAELGPGPWGQEGSPTHVGRVRVMEVERARVRLEGPAAEQATTAVGILAARGALEAAPVIPATTLPPSPGDSGHAVAVIAEPGLEPVTTELLGAGAELAAAVGGHVVALGAGPGDAWRWGMRGADLVAGETLPDVAEDAAAAVEAWVTGTPVWAVLAPSTAWGREVAARLSARLGTGLVGDAVELSVEDGRLVAWKPAFGGRLVAAITCSSELQMATVRPGVLPAPAPREVAAAVADWSPPPPRGRVVHHDRVRDDDVETLARATTTIGVGAGLVPDDYPALEPLRRVLGAELAASRKVTDRGWLPRSRQVGITGRSISSRLHVAVGVSGKFNHVVGIRGAGTVLAINRDPAAAIFDHADVGMVALWQEAVEALTAALMARAATV